MRILVIGLIILGVFITIAPLVIQKFIHYKLGPARMAQVNDIKTKPITVPADWLQVKPYPADLRQITHDWMAEYETSKSLFGAKEFHAFDFATTYTEVELTSLSLQIEALRPAIQRARQLANHPEYDMDIAGSREFEMYRESGGVYVAFQQLTKLLLADAKVLSERGDCASSLEQTLIVVRLSKSHPAATLVTHMLSIGIQNNAVNAMASLAAGCSDTTAIQHALDEMNRMEPEVKRHTWSNPALLDQLGILRQFAREGYPVALASGKPLAFFMDQSIVAMADYPQWQLDHLSPSDPHTPRRREYLQQQIAKSGVRSGSSGALKWGLGQTGIKDVLYNSMAISTFEQSNIRAQVARARYDLARLSLAKRLAVLQGAEDTSATLEAVAKQMALNDEFDSGSLIRVADDQFYSVGPDVRNDRAKITYDPTNGTISAGDIVLRSVGKSM